MSPSAIDIHTHVISTDTQRYPHAPLGGRQSEWSRKRPVSVEQIVKDQDAAGISKAVLVQASTCYGHDNAYVADAVQTHPERFVGVFSCDILQPDTVQTMSAWAARGLAGFRVFTTGSTMPGQADWLDDARTFPAWRFAEETNLPVCLQMTAAGIPQLMNLLKRFPRLRVVLDHLARPAYDDGPPYQGADSLWALADYPNVYLKVTERNLVGASTGRATPETFFGRLLSLFGAARVGWGSNYPAEERTLPELLTLAEDTFAFLPESEREWIFHRTAQALYPGLSDEGR